MTDVGWSSQVAAVSGGSASGSRLRELMDAAAAHELIRMYGIDAPVQRVVSSPIEAADAAEEIGFPVVLKAVRSDIVHKTEVGAVELGLSTSADVESAACALTERVGGSTDLLVQEMADDGIEMIVGARRDPAFGPVVVVGLGGIWAEALADVSIRLAPVSDAQAREMLGELRAAPILRGDRGVDGADIESLSATIASVSRLAVEHLEVLELDLNPVICRPDGVSAVDVRIICSDPIVVRSHVGPSRDTMNRLFEPRSIAIVGASRNVGKQSGRLLSHLLKHGYAGDIYAVNPNASEIMGCVTVPTISDLPVVPDLACIALPSAAVVGVLAECGEFGIPAAVVFTSGFAEVGGAGQERQAEVLDVTARYGIRVCGPNTAGLVSMPSRMCATMGMAFEAEMVRVGDVALVTQSGAIGGSLLSRLWDAGAGFSHWVSVGNEADLGLGDYLLWLADDPATEVIGLFIESIRDVERFREGCERARERGKPVVAYKTGYSAAGRRAVQSHTAALAGDNAAYGAAFYELGVIQVDDLQALIDACVLLSWQPVPRGPRVGVVSASGGACSVVADECFSCGLEVPQLSADARDQIADLVPAFASTDNPVDVTMEINIRPEMIGDVTEVLLAQSEIDAVIVMLTTNADPPAIRVADGVVAAAAKTDKPIMVARMGADFLAPESLRRYREAHIPLVPMPDRAVRALAVAVDHGRTLTVETPGHALESMNRAPREGEH